MKHSAIPAMALSVLSLGVIPGRAAPGSGAQAGWLRHHGRGEGPAMTAALRVRGEKPSMPYDPNTKLPCTWWYDNDGSLSCEELWSIYLIKPAQFTYWNPSVSETCENFKTGFSYCVEGPFAPSPSPTTVRSSSSTVSTTTTIRTTSTSTTRTTTTTTVAPGNGIETPAPIQPGMVDNCDAFYFVEAGQGCSDVLSKNGITLAQLFAWNPSVKADCSGMWANVYVCVSTVGHTPSTPTTTRGNGIATPTPIQDGMVGDCDAFHFVEDGQTCSDVLSKNRITLAQLFAWNPSVKADCSGLWARVYVCVSTVGHTPSTPTSTRGNGIATPTPTQAGMVTNCKAFHFVAAGDNCDSIARKYGITVSNFIKWNPAVGNSCAGLWANTYACVAVL